VLAPMNFEALYVQRMQQAQNQAAAAETPAPAGNA
jgi:preprotein translocase subunit SecB